MLTMVQNLNPILLDVIVVSIFVFIIFFGFIKGIKKTFISLVLFLFAFLLSFSSLTNSIKSVIATKILDVNAFLPAGSSKTFSFLVVLLSTFLSTLAFFVLIYVLVHVIKILIGILLKKRSGGSDEEGKSMLGRIFAGLLSLLYQGLVMIVLLLCLNTNIVGMKNVIQKTAITKVIVNAVEKVDSKVDADIKSTVILKFAKGDLFANIDDKLAMSFEDIEKEAEALIAKKEYMDVLTNENISNEEISLIIKERLIGLRSLSILQSNIDAFGVSKDDFAKMAEEWLVAMNRASKNRNLEKIKFNINEYGEMRLSFAEAGLGNNLITLYEEIAIGN